MSAVAMANSREKYHDLYHRLVDNTRVTEKQFEGTPCWEHTAPLSRPEKGYPRISVWVDGRHTKKLAHVLMFDLVHGAPPEGFERDHRCHNHRCINPAHLAAVPIMDNRKKNDPNGRWGSKSI